MAKKSFSSMPARGSVLGILLIASSCGHDVQTNPPTTSQEQELLYRKGSEAFRLATPDGYIEAVTAFREASTLAPTRCEYSLHLAESLILLAQEQKYNLEDFEPRLSEAVGIVGSVQRETECAAFEPFVDRLRALSAPGPNALALVNRAIELDPKDAMNWYVLWRLNLGNSQPSILRAAELAPDLPLIQYELGNYRLLRGEYAEAKLAFEHALALSPRHFRSMIGLAYAIGSIGFDTQVESFYRKA